MVQVALLIIGVVVSPPRAVSQAQKSHESGQLHLDHPSADAGLPQALTASSRLSVELLGHLAEIGYDLRFGCRMSSMEVVLLSQRTRLSNQPTTNK